MFDQDKNDRLDTKEFEQGARQAGADREVPMELLMKQYKNFDRNGDGLDRDEFMALFNVMNDPAAQADLMWASMDLDYDGRVSFDDFMKVAGMMREESSNPETMKPLFDMMDKDGDGMMSRPEFDQMI
jgi:Ca2+-binding EF-hand superfamily protein